MSRPQVRASWVKGLLAAAQGRAELAEELERELSDEARRTIDKALRISWLEFSVYYELIHAFDRIAGGEGTRAVFSDFVFGLRDSPLYMPLLRGIAVFGAGAESMMRLYARGYGLSFRDTGTMELRPRETGPGVRIVLSGIPEECRVMPYVHGHAGSAHGGFRLAHTLARVEADLSALREGTLVLDAQELGPAKPSVADANAPATED